jgi:hypothetical protein
MACKYNMKFYGYVCLLRRQYESVFLDTLHFIVSATPRWSSVKGTHHLPTKLCSIISPQESDGYSNMTSLKVGTHQARHTAQALVHMMSVQQTSSCGAIQRPRPQRNPRRNTGKVCCSNCSINAGHLIHVLYIWLDNVLVRMSHKTNIKVENALQKISLQYLVSYSQLNSLQRYDVEKAT